MADDILGTLTYEAAKAFVGRTYHVQSGTRIIDLVVTNVVAAVEHGPRPKELKREAFSIFFRGPADAPLPQRMYPLMGETEDFPNLFLVPIGRTKDGYEYEAVFT